MSIFDNITEQEWKAPKKSIFDDIKPEEWEQPQEPSFSVGRIASQIGRSAGKGLAAGTFDVFDSIDTAAEYVTNRLGLQRKDREPKQIGGYLSKIIEKSESISEQDPFLDVRKSALSDLPGKDDFGPPASIKNKNIIDNPEMLKNPDWWVYNASRMAPGLVASILPAAKAKKAITIAGQTMRMTPKVIRRLATLGASITGGAIGGGLEATSTYKDVLETTGDEKEAARAAELMFFFVAGLNAVSTGKILDEAGKTFVSKIGKTAGSAALEAVTEGLEEPSEVTAKIAAKYLRGKELPKDIEQQYIQSLKSAATVAPIAGLTGGAASALNQFTSNGETKSNIPKITKDQIIEGLKSNTINLDSLNELKEGYPDLAATIDEAVAEFQQEGTVDYEKRKREFVEPVKSARERNQEIMDSVDLDLLAEAEQSVERQKAEKSEGVIAEEAAIADRTTAKRRFNALSQIWDTLSDGEQEKAIDLILPRQEASEIEQERQKKAEAQTFDREKVAQEQTKRASDAATILRGLERRGIKIGKEERARLEQEAGIQKPEKQELKETGRWKEPVMEVDRDKKNIEGIQGGVGGRQELGGAVQDQGGSQKAPETGRVLQAQEKVTEPQPIETKIEASQPSAQEPAATPGPPKEASESSRRPSLQSISDNRVEVSAVKRGDKPAFYGENVDQSILDTAKADGLNIEQGGRGNDWIITPNTESGKQTASELKTLIEDSKKNPELLKDKDWHYKFSKLLGYDEELARSIRSKAHPAVLEKKRLDKLYAQEDQAQQGENTNEAIKSFKTAKGSSYTVNSDGTTTRDKAPRPEHPGPLERGIQKTSTKTWYVDIDGLNKLALVQAKGGIGQVGIGELPDGKIATKYISGPARGKFIKGTIVSPSRIPKIGLYPVEFWDDKRTIHFGNKITEVEYQGNLPSQKENQKPINDLGKSGRRKIAGAYGEVGFAERRKKTEPVAVGGRSGEDRRLKGLKDSLKNEKGSSQLLTDVVNIFAKKQTETPEFKKWFGDSKVVDDKGRPLVVYHGTGDKFDVFKRSSLGRVTGSPSSKLGFFFTNKSESASEYADFATAEQPNEEELIKINELKDELSNDQRAAKKKYGKESEQYKKIRDDISVKQKELTKKYFELYVKPKQNVIHAFLKIDNPLVYDMEGEHYRSESYKNIIKYAIENANDGVIIKNTFDNSNDVMEDVYVVFESNQIKSATENTGLFDPNNPSIRGESQLLTDVASYSADLVRKGVNTYEKFKLKMFQKFRTVWDKIKGHMRSLWDALNNQRGEINLGKSKKQRADDIIALLNKKNEVKSVKVEPETKSEQTDISDYEKVKDIWFGDKDERILENNVELSNLQDEIKNVLGIKRYNQKARDIDSAIQIYIDLKNNPDHLKKYYSELTPRQKRIVDLSQGLPENIKKIANKISDSYKNIGLEALDTGVIRNVRDNYAARIWDLKGKPGSQERRKFGTTTRHAKQRKFETILEGWASGYDLKIYGSTNNLNILKDEIVKTIQDKKFLKELMGLVTPDGDPLVTTKQLDGYEEIKHPNFVKWEPVGKAKENKSGEVKWYGRNSFADETGQVWERKALYAPKNVAKNLNNILGTSKLADTPGIRFITKYNAIMKSWILQSSFFHHLAFMRSYYLGTNHKTWSEMNIRKAYKEGGESIKKLDPVIRLAVKNGLTLGVYQDWNESLVREKTAIGRVLDKNKVSREIKDKILLLREMQADFLFSKFGAGLKAKAFAIEYRNQLKKHPEQNPDIIAKRVANLINDDFGGLHLGRMGRNPTTQHIFRIFALAPDWTESNIRTMVKSIKAGSKEETALYRKFWAGVLIKGIGATVLANFVMAGGDPEELWKRYKKAWKAGHFRWLDVDITPIYQALGGETKEHKYFSILGHFKDPTKFIVHPVRSLHHKGSVVYKTMHEALTGVNWAGQKYATAKELVDEGRLTKYGAASPLGYSQIPSYAISQIIGAQPVQVQNAIRWATGDMEAFDAITNSMGLGTSTTYSPKNKVDFSGLPDKYVSELERLEIGFNLPRRKVSINNTEVELDEDVYRKIANEFSEKLSERFKRKMSIENWDEIPDERKRKRLMEIRTRLGRRYNSKIRIAAQNQIGSK